MALTITLDTVPTQPQLRGNTRSVSGTVTFDSSYPTGGEAVDLKLLGLAVLTDLRVEPGGSSTNNYQLRWNRSVSAPTIMAFQGDNDAGADGPGVEVANTGNLSSVVARFEAIGY